MAEHGPHDAFQHIFIDSTSALPIASALEEAAADIGLAYTVVTPITVTRFGVTATVAFDYDTETTEGVVALDRRVLYGSDTGRTEIDTVAMTDGTALGKSIYVNCSEDCDVGDQLVLEIKTAAAGGTEVGDWIGWFCYTPRGSSDANQADLTVTT